MSIPLLDEQVMVYKHLDESVSLDQDTERKVHMFLKINAIILKSKQLKR